MSQPKQPVSRRNVIVAIVATVVVCGLVAAVVVLLSTRGNDSPVSAPPPTTPSTTTSQPTDPGTTTSSGPEPSSGTAEPSAGGTGADGCLGGKDPFAALLPAQENAPLTADGAAAFARTVARWMLAYPADPAAGTAIKKIAAPDGTMAQYGLKDLADAAAAFAKDNVLTVEVLPTGSSYRLVGELDTDPGAVTNALVQVRVEVRRTKADGSTTQVQLTSEFALIIKGGKWTVDYVDKPATDPDSPNNVTPLVPYASGC